MVIGVGCDIMLLSSVREESLLENAPFYERVFTEREKKEGRARGISGTYFRTRFCGKEAVMKALHMDGNLVRLNEIEILCSQIGEPQVFLHGTVKKHAANRKIENIFLSLSYDGAYAMAYAVAESNMQQNTMYEGRNDVRYNSEFNCKGETESKAGCFS